MFSMYPLFNSPPCCRYCRRCWSGCRPRAVRASLYIVGVWIRQPKELNMKPLLVMNKLETRALGGCPNITTPTRRS